jgi:two-component system, cell cycle response regulator
MSKKVLTIDDSKTVRLIIARHLRPFGVEILEAENGAVGVEKAQAELPDLILLDYNMPVMDGYHTLVELKTDHRTKAIPVMMLTTETVKDTVIKLIKLGLKDYIAKPFTRELLLQKANGILSIYPGDTPPAETELQQAGRPPEKATVLVVDDKENILKIVKEYLSEKHHVVIAPTGQAAMTAIASVKPDWLFLDLDLPDTPSQRIAEAFRALKKPGARVIGMALRTAAKDVSNAKANGIREFLYKPFTKEDVLAVAAGSAPAAPSFQPKRPARGFLASYGNARLLSCPEANDPEFQSFINALSDEIFREIGDMADEGLGQLVIKVSPAIVSNFALAKAFAGVLGHGRSLALTISLVSMSPRIKEWLSHHPESRELPIYDSVEAALAALGIASAEAAAS